jgi:anti-sigma B factor antagonist
VSSPEFRVEPVSSNGVVVIAASGEIDLATAETFHDAIAHHVGPGRKIVLEFSGVEFLDSSGIHVLIVNRQAAVEVGGTLVVRNPNDIVRRVLEAVRLDELLIEEP